jgi:chaperonin GroES
MAVTLLYDRILVRPILEDEKTKPLIITPDMAKEKPTRATVLAIGPGAVEVCPAPAYIGGVFVERPMTVKVGDVIVFGKYSGQEVTIDGAKCLIMREEDVLYIESRE